MIPTIQDLIHEPIDRPRRSSRLAEKSQGMSISVMEKALNKKKRKASSLSGSSKSSRADSSSAKDQEAYSTSVPPHLLAYQLIQMGRECGFDEKEGGSFWKQLVRRTQMSRSPNQESVSRVGLASSACICIFFLFLLHLHLP
jgi:hypothetical protein